MQYLFTNMICIKGHIMHIDVHLKWQLSNYNGTFIIIRTWSLHGWRSNNVANSSSPPDMPKVLCSTHEKDILI